MKKTLKYGIIIGVSNILFILFEYMLEWDKNLFMRNFGFLSLIILALGVHYGIKSKRDNELDGYINYRNAFVSGFLIALYVGIITGVFSYFYMRDINPELSDIIIKERQELFTKMIDSQILTQEEVAKKLVRLQKEYSPMGQMILGFGGSLILGLIFSSVSSFFLHRKNPEE